MPPLGICLEGKADMAVCRSRGSVRGRDAFYVGPGHSPTFEAGTEMIQFSPTQELKATDEAIRQYMEANG